MADVKGRCNKSNQEHRQQQQHEQQANQVFADP